MSAFEMFWERKREYNGPKTYNGRQIDLKMLEFMSGNTVIIEEFKTDNPNYEDSTAFIKLTNKSPNVIAFRFEGSIDRHLFKPNTGCIPSYSYAKVKIDWSVKELVLDWSFGNFPINYFVETMVVLFPDINMPEFPSVQQLRQFNNLWEDKTFMEIMAPNVSRQCVEVLTKKQNEQVIKKKASDDSWEQVAPPSVSSPEIVDQRSCSSDFDLAFLDRIDVRFNVNDSFLRQDDQADLARQYIAQNDELDVTFKHQSGVIKCSKRSLTWSNYFINEIAQHDSSDCIFDYRAYPKEVIQLFLDLIHNIHSEQEKSVFIPELLSLLHFLNSEGKQNSALERVLSRDIMSQLVNLLENYMMEYMMEYMESDLGTILLIGVIVEFIPTCHRVNNLGPPDLQFEKFVGEIITDLTEIDSAIAALSMDTTPNKELIAMMFAFEDENDVQELVHKAIVTYGTRLFYKYHYNKI